MIRWVQLAAAHAPGGAELRLMQRGGEFSITVGADELMNSRRGGSEKALGDLACRSLRDAPTPRVLIGGLGMGFTLRAVLAALSPQAEITVAELVSEVIAWARGPLAGVFDGGLDDPRVRLVQGDVASLIGRAQTAYDAIILDIDNGPDGLVRSANDGLYRSHGLAAVRRALRPGGVLAIWSATHDAAFTRRLATAGFSVQEHTARSGGRNSGARHLVWIGSLPRARSIIN